MTLYDRLRLTMYSNYLKRLEIIANINKSSEQQRLSHILLITQTPEEPFLILYELLVEQGIDFTLFSTTEIDKIYFVNV